MIKWPWKTQQPQAETLAQWQDALAIPLLSPLDEQEQQRLISGLIKQREAWQPARQRAHTKPVAKRMSQRDRELMECFRNR